MASLGLLISLWAGIVLAFVDAVVEAHDQTPLRHPVSLTLFNLLYVVMLVLP